MEFSYQHISKPILPSQEEVILARETSRKLAAYMEPEQVMNLKIQDKKGNQADIELPASVVRLLLDMLEQMANGNAITLMPLHAELTTKQAADLLNISRPHLIKLLDKGNMPFRKVGSHRRVKVEDVLAYKRESFSRRTEALNELTAQAQELNWGYD
jgi:excisionase family DNA binding protein